MTARQQQDFDLAYNVVVELSDRENGTKMLEDVRAAILAGTPRDSAGGMENQLYRLANEGMKATIVNLIDRTIGDPYDDESADVSGDGKPYFDGEEEDWK